MITAAEVMRGNLACCANMAQTALRQAREGHFDRAIGTLVLANRLHARVLADAHLSDREVEREAEALHPQLHAAMREIIEVANA